MWVEARRELRTVGNTQRKAGNQEMKTKQRHTTKSGLQESRQGRVQETRKWKENFMLYPQPKVPPICLNL